MTVTLHLESAITAVSGLSVTGLTICDLDDIPNAADVRLSYLMPDQGLVTDFALERVTMGSMHLVGMDATYTLNYRLLYKPVGSERGLANIAPGLAALAVDVIEAILNASALTGLVKWTPSLADFGIYSDPSENGWYGCRVLIECLDFVQ